MAKHKSTRPTPQPQHKKSRPSQHDRRARLTQPNPNRQHTQQAQVPLVGALAEKVKHLATALDARLAFRLAIIIAGMMLADDRRTASAWFVVAGVRDDWDCFYHTLRSIGRTAEKIATSVLRLVVAQLDPGPGGRITLALDDTPEKRYGKHVEGAGVHHDPTAGPAGGEFCYGHNWVTLAWLAKHPRWGTIALPIRSLLYVRQSDVPRLAAKYSWKFRTKHELAADLVTWFVTQLKTWGIVRKLWIVVDGAYAARPFLDPVLKAGATVVSRLRKDARLYHEPPPRQPGQRGRPRKRGEQIDLKKRAAHPAGWQSIMYHCRGQEVTREYKTFEALSPLCDKLIRVVLVRFDGGGWIPYFCTDSTASVRDILEAAGDRWSLEEVFHDTKEIWGAGQQQVRNVWSNIGCWHLNQWLFTLVELTTWNLPASVLVDRRDRPWDNSSRRPSHADRRRQIAREMLRKQFPQLILADGDTQKTRTVWETLLQLCT